MTTFEWDGRRCRTAAVKADLVARGGDEVLRVERDLEALPFDKANLAHTVDEPTYVALADLDMQDGSVQVDVLARIQAPAPFPAAQGFIGLAFRAAPDDSAFESIYLRPNAARSDDQFVRNHAVQYFAYPDYKFNRLREEQQGRYETYADIALDEWITMRVEFAGRRAALYLNDQRSPAFVVSELKGSSERGTIGLWVDVGTVGFFRNLRLGRISSPAASV